jgi:Domain of unknown function (DUF4357)/GIY-YIG catalytic domain
MGKKLTVYLIEGSDTGSRTIEIGNWSGKALHSPRANLSKIIDRPEFGKPGVYILKSDPVGDAFDERIYIGEAEKIGARLKQHLANADRDFKEVIAFISKDELLTKSHIKYIESKLVGLAREAKNSELENGNTPTESALSEADISDMEYFIEQIRIVLPVAGYRFLIPNTVIRKEVTVVATPESETYTLETKAIKASLIETDEGFIVLKDSLAAKTHVKSLNPGWLRIRLRLIESKVLVEQGEALQFSQDAVFSSLSAAAAVVMGSQTSGTTAWKNKAGKTYKELQERLVEPPTT